MEVGGLQRRVLALLRGCVLVVCPAGVVPLSRGAEGGSFGLPWGFRGGDVRGETGMLTLSLFPPLLRLNAGQKG